MAIPYQEQPFEGRERPSGFVRRSQEQLQSQSIEWTDKDYSMDSNPPPTNWPTFFVFLVLRFLHHPYIDLLAFHPLSGSSEHMSSRSITWVSSFRTSLDSFFLFFSSSGAHFFFLSLGPSITWDWNVSVWDSYFENSGIPKDLMASFEEDKAQIDAGSLNELVSNLVSPDSGVDYLKTFMLSSKSFVWYGFLLIPLSPLLVASYFRMGEAVTLPLGAPGILPT